MSDELLPCPWCGGKATVELSYFDSTYTVECQSGECGVIPQSIEHTTRASAIAAWNRRSSPSPTRGDGVALIAAERQRQTTAEGWTAEHDDEHAKGEMARAGAWYATPPDLRHLVYVSTGQHSTPERSLPHEQPFWPWESRWWKPCPNDRVRELVKAGALIAAEIDRLLRARRHLPLNLPADRTKQIAKACDGADIGDFGKNVRSGLCPNCPHALSRHDPEDGTCDAPSAVPGEVGVCQCGRTAPTPPSRQLTAEEVRAKAIEVVRTTPFETEPASAEIEAAIIFMRSVLVDELKSVPLDAKGSE